MHSFALEGGLVYSHVMVLVVKPLLLVHSLILLLENKGAPSCMLMQRRGRNVPPVFFLLLEVPTCLVIRTHLRQDTLTGDEIQLLVMFLAC